MTDAELIARLRTINKNYELARGVHVDIRQAADRIEQLVATNEELTKERDALIEWNGQASVRAERAEDRAEAAEAKLAENEVRLGKAKAGPHRSPAPPSQRSKETPHDPTA